MIAAEFATEMRTITRHIRREWYKRNLNWVLEFGPSPFNLAVDDASTPAVSQTTRPRTFKFKARSATMRLEIAFKH